MPNYSFYQSPQSNETSQTYFLERTQSAKITLEKALKICPQTSSASSSALSASAKPTPTGGVGLGGGGGSGRNPNENVDKNESEEQVGTHRSLYSLN